MDYSMTTQFLMELIGTMVLVIFGDGVCCAVSLNKSKAQGAGWIVITIGWGLAVCMGVLIAGPYTGAHLNPAVSVGLAVAGKFPWASVPAYVAGQMIGGVIGGMVSSYGCSTRITSMPHPTKTPSWAYSVQLLPSATILSTSSASSSQPCCWCS